MRLGLALATLLLAVTGCSSDEPDEPRRAVDQGSQPAVDELAEHDQKPCPQTLVDPRDDHGFGTEASADRAPWLGEQDEAWVCVYSAIDNPAKETEQGAYFDWTRTGKPSPVPAGDLADLQTALDGLTPAAEHRMCTADLGPRVMFVTALEGDLTGVVVNVFGCGDVRLSDDPYTNPPGVATQPGTVSGVLTSPALAEFARKLARTLARSAR